MTHAQPSRAGGPGLRGCGTALATPFNTDGSIDDGALRALVDWQIEEGIHFLVPCGSTGEAATMSLEEHCSVVRVTIDQAKGRVPIVAGAGSNDTQKAIALSKEMRDLGATHLLHTSPMYNKPPQRGIVAHYRAIAEAVDLPIVVYNVPGRTGSNIEAKTTLEMAKIRGIAAVKEASGSLAQITDILRGRGASGSSGHSPAARNSAPFSVLSGDDEMALAVMALGGDGVVSVISNVVPRLMSQLCERMLGGDLAGARDIHFQLLPWMRAAFIESNPIPVKAALAMMGKARNVLRLPLVPLADTHAETVRGALRGVGAVG
ncbi:MAG TPA: 4-hydroxy-tetrahydrodipicolinate synthase [Gemmatimonadaceae bacterium]|jgi:4-hydroxy-tetrahydrodipicolinate synthase|nr:4-hydroxy-tetrahydrodipicolinate synthase [Gemmatimonadaceae bacterium]